MNRVNKIRRTYKGPEIEDADKSAVTEHNTIMKRGILFDMI